MGKKGFSIFFIGIGLGIICGYIISTIFIHKKTEENVSKPDFGSTVESEFDQFIRMKMDDLEKNPENIQSRIDLANIFFDLGRDKEAAEQYNEVIKRQPDNLNALSDLGVCYRRMKEPRKALEIFNKVAEKDPKHLIAWYNIAVTSYYDLNDIKTARTALEKAMKIDPFYENAIRLKAAMDADKRR
jgi:tetratricopeptide (TPR) repeat protein